MDGIVPSVYDATTSLKHMARPEFPAFSLVLINVLRMAFEWTQYREPRDPVDCQPHGIDFDRGGPFTY